METINSYNIDGTSMVLPMILAYADDIIVLTENKSELDKFLEEFM